MQRSKKKGSLNEMKFGTKINLVILNMMEPFILNLKIQFGPENLPKMFWLRQIKLAPNFIFFSLRQIKSAPNLENMWLRKIKSVPKTSFLPVAKFNQCQN